MSRFSEQKVTGNLVKILEERIVPATLHIRDGKIEKIEEEAINTPINPQLPFITPGFVDAHVHIESSLLVPSEFARMAVLHGTVATVSDPHEIANVCGVGGVRFMIENGKKVPFKFNFGAPSCVPATTFETAGAEVTVTDVKELLALDEIRYLSEMMNFPGVIYNDSQVHEKIKAAHAVGKPVDGHAPGLRGDDLKTYFSAGISTDHECFTYEEAKEKLELGMKVLIREGSAAKNFNALIDLLNDYPDDIMFCSDDKHPDSLEISHINALCARAIEKGIPLFHVLKAACINPVLHYKLPVGLLKEGDAADFIVLEDLSSFKVNSTYINGELVAENGKSFIQSVSVQPLNQFDCSEKIPADFELKINTNDTTHTIPVIEALEGQLITLRQDHELPIINGVVTSITEKDILKIVVVNRYFNARVAHGFITNFGFKKGAIASSVAHDSHNIVAVGTSDEAICEAVNAVIREKGGLSCFDGNSTEVLGLPVAGLMSAKDAYEVSSAYTRLDRMAKSLGTNLAAPFMTLSFMALLVIPKLKLSDKGLFDGEKFQLISY